MEFKKKVAKIFIHGFLHLLGYDHVKLKDFNEMQIEEEKIYKTIETKIVKTCLKKTFIIIFTLFFWEQ